MYDAHLDGEGLTWSQRIRASRSEADLFRVLEELCATLHGLGVAELRSARFASAEDVDAAAARLRNGVVMARPGSHRYVVQRALEVLVFASRELQRLELARRHPPPETQS